MSLFKKKKKNHNIEGKLSVLGLKHEIKQGVLYYSKLIVGVHSKFWIN